MKIFFKNKKGSYDPERRLVMMAEIAVCMSAILVLSSSGAVAVLAILLLANLFGLLEWNAVFFLTKLSYWGLVLTLSLSVLIGLSVPDLYSVTSTKTGKPHA